ncbi:MAG: hypothetical protein GX640_05195 [Fibrobacter sp.]|nr:hypothetical protein [Fibrobacter sp.]
MSHISKKPPLESTSAGTATIPLHVPVELAVLSVKKAGIRCKHISSQQPVTFRKVRNEVEGEIITVLPSKVWQFNNSIHLTGEIIDRRFDASVLNLVPLTLKERGVFNPDDEDLIDEDDPFEKYYLPVLAYGARKEFEMEQIIPLENTDDMGIDPISEAVEAHQFGDFETAYKILKENLAEDLRCIDAHAHLGNFEFESSDYIYFALKEKAKRHFEAGIKIAELSFSPAFHDLLPWEYLNNRPYLRCLHGYGLCLYRSGNIDAAKMVFEKMIWLNPKDNQGVRVLLADIDSGKSWQDLEKEERR